MRNQPMVGLLQLPEGYPYHSGSRRHIASMAADKKSILKLSLFKIERIIQF